MKKAATIIVITVLFILIGLLLGGRFEHRTYYAVGRFKWVHSNNDWVSRDPNFFQRQLQAMTNVLTDRDTRRTLAAKSNVDEKHFQFIGVGPVKGTYLVYVHYSGADSNTVLCVASNAIAMLVTFYTTNQPSMEVKYIEAHCFTPRSWWEDFYLNLPKPQWWPFR